MEGARANRKNLRMRRPLLAFLQRRREPDFVDCTGEKNSGQGSLPRVMTPGPDGTERNTYFYNPTTAHNGRDIVRNYASKDPRSAGDILLGYFYFFGFEFDWRRQVVSVISPETVLKEEKARNHGWKRHARLSIEDPFEDGYDVGHVLREETARRLRAEFARAYFILSGGTGKRGRAALAQLLEVYEAPAKEEDKGREGGEVAAQ